MRIWGQTGSNTPYLFPIRKADSHGLRSSLVRQQTNRDVRRRCKGEASIRRATEKRLDAAAAAYEYYIPQASEIESAFRHGRWSSDRLKVVAALRACKAPPQRIERFEKCGADAVIEMTTDGSKSRVRAHYCGDRFCAPCCEARARKVRRNLLRWSEGQTLRFITLTLEQNEKPLVSRLNHILESFVRLRAQKFWSEAVTAGAYFIEITRGRRGGHWHVHIHAIVCGTYLAQDRLSDGWRVASRGSYITHVRAVNDATRDIGYVAKYSTKGFDKSVLADPDALIECMIGLRARRMLGTFGAWRAMALDAPPAPELQWRLVGKLDTIVRAALNQQTWAKSVLRSLKCEATGDDERPLFASIDWDESG